MKFDGINNPVDSRLQISTVETILYRIVIHKLDGKIHRENGPATIYYTHDWKIDKAMWSKYNALHRLDGPAIQWSDETVGWWVSGKNVGISNCSKEDCKCIVHANEEFLRAIKMKAFW